LLVLGFDIVPFVDCDVLIKSALENCFILVWEHTQAGGLLGSSLDGNWILCIDFVSMENRRVVNSTHNEYLLAVLSPCNGRQLGWKEEIFYDIELFLLDSRNLQYNQPLLGHHSDQPIRRDTY
jgi:hypothetical protein